jgi:hypothetical protein
MRHTHRSPAGSVICDDPRALAEIQRQVLSEYRCLPGLKLTLPQARRLWGLDQDCCARVMDALLREGALTLDATGAYVRGDTGNSSRIA